MLLLYSIVLYMYATFTPLSHRINTIRETLRIVSTQIFQNSDIDAIVNVLIRDSPKFVADMKVNDFEVSMIVSKVEDQLELAGVTEDRRPYPCGLVGMPDRRVRLTFVYYKQVCVPCPKQLESVYTST